MPTGGRSAGRTLGALQRGRVVQLTTVLGSAPAGIDATVVGIALPQIGQDLDVSFGARTGGTSRRDRAPRRRRPIWAP